MANRVLQRMEPDWGYDEAIALLNPKQVTLRGAGVKFAGFHELKTCRNVRASESRLSRKLLRPVAENLLGAFGSPPALHTGTNLHYS